MIFLILLLLSTPKSVNSNLALNKPIRVNDLPNTSSQKYVDGFDTTCGTSMQRTPEGPQWVVIDLNSRYDITAFQITTNGGGAAYDQMNVEIMESNPMLAADDNKPRPSPCLCLDRSAITSSNTTCPTVCTGRFVRIQSMKTLLTGYCDIRIYGTKNMDPVIRYEFTKQVTAVHVSSQSQEASDVQVCAELCTALPTCIGVQYLSNSTCNICTSILEDSGNQSGVSYGLTHIITTCD